MKIKLQGGWGGGGGYQSTHPSYCEEKQLKKATQKML